MIDVLMWALLIVGWLVVLRESARFFRNSRAAQRAIAKDAATTARALVEADLFRDPREWVAEAERAVEMEVEGRAAAPSFAGGLGGGRVEGPEILQAFRYGGQIRITYSAGSSGYTRIVADVRTVAGSWRREVTSPSITGLLVFSDPFDSAPCQVRLRAAHTSGLPVTESWTVNVPER